MCLLSSFEINHANNGYIFQVKYLNFTVRKGSNGDEWTLELLQMTVECGFPLSVQTKFHPSGPALCELVMCAFGRRGQRQAEGSR